MITRKQLADPTLLVACIAAGMADGGGIYESMLVAPAWIAAPPASFALIQAPEGIPLIRFWIPIHSFLTLTMIAALVANWRNLARRHLMWVALGAYVVMRVWTFAYFIPEIAYFMSVPAGGPPSPELTARAANWAWWSWWRAPLSLITHAAMLIALLKPNLSPSPAEARLRDRRAR